MNFFFGMGGIASGRWAYLRLRRSYQVAFWLPVELVGAASVVFALIKIGSAKSELTPEERAELPLEVC